MLIELQNQQHSHASPDFDTFLASVLYHTDKQ